MRHLKQLLRWITQRLVPNIGALGARVNYCVSTIDAKTGETLTEEYGHNIVTTAGLNMVIDLLAGDASASLTHFAMGSGSTAATLADTTLDTETEREAVTSTTKGPGTVTFQYLMASTANNGQTFREAGMVTAAVAGTLFNRWVYTAIPKTSSIQILYTLTITLAEV